MELSNVMKQIGQTEAHAFSSFNLTYMDCPFTQSKYTGCTCGRVHYNILGNYLSIAILTCVFGLPALKLYHLIQPTEVPGHGASAGS